jgi:hypothetical protein
MTDCIRIVDRRTWRRVEPEPPELPELPLARYCRERRELAAAQIRWAADIVDLDPPDRRAVITKRMNKVRTGLAHIQADLEALQAEAREALGPLRGPRRWNAGIADDLAAVRAAADRIEAALGPS